MFENDVAWLMRQMRVTSGHVDYLRDGQTAAASVTFSGEPALVRELLTRFAEASEAGQLERARVTQGPRA
jgi:hypothetical protein